MYNTVLLAVDLNEGDGHERLVQAATTLGADQIHVVNVMPDAGMSVVGMALGPEHRDKMMAEATARLTAWVDANLAGATPHVRQGSVYDCILKTADKVGADAIVVGAHSPELKDYLFGPNAARIVRHASQSVLVVR